MKKWIFLSLIYGLITLFPLVVISFEEQITHPKITEKAVRDISSLDTYLKITLGLEKGVNSRFPSDSQDPSKAVIELLKKGSTVEDTPICRGTNHFHNPLKQWDRAGITTIWWPICPSWDVTSNLTRHSALTWATGYNSYNDSIINRSHQQMGWDKAREYFYAALTENAQTTREDYFAKTFQAVGQVMHLLQDMAVPAHVRNDFWNSHVWTGGTNPYELYVKLNTTKIMDLTKTQIESVMPAFTNPRQTDFWDTSDGSISMPPQISNPALQSKAGLAEYTNANFVSEGTLFSNFTEFEYPKKSSTGMVTYNISDSFNPGRTVKRSYYYKTHDWEVGYHLAGADYSNFYDPQASPPYPVIDALVNGDYADRLLPRAVGYSAGLLNYFFRGRISLVPGGDAMDQYVITNGSTEKMTGYFSLYYEDQNSNRTLVKKFEEITLPPNSQSALVTFPTPTTPVPKEKNTYFLVFQGKMGNEDGAIAGKSAKWWREEWDNGPRGNHYWIHAVWDELGIFVENDTGSTVEGGKLIKDNRWSEFDNISYVGVPSVIDSMGKCWNGSVPFNCAFTRGFPYAITPSTRISLKLDALDVQNQIQQCGNGQPTGSCQGVVLKIKMGDGHSRTLNFTTPGNECHFVYDVQVPLGQEYTGMLYDILAQFGPVVEPVEIMYIAISQYKLCAVPETLIEQHMELDYVRLEER